MIGIHSGLVLVMEHLQPNLLFWKGISTRNLDVIGMALNVNIQKYQIKMHKLPFVEDYLSINDTV